MDDLCTLPLTNSTSYANLSISLTPKTEYSCQNSFLPGSVKNDSEDLILNGNGCCVNAAADFASVVTPGIGPEEWAERCRLTIFRQDDCEGPGNSLDSSGMRAGGCAFVGGRSGRFECGRKRTEGTGKSALRDKPMSCTDVWLDAYAALAASLCANAATLLPNSTSSTNMALNTRAPLSLPFSVSTTITSGQLSFSATSAPKPSGELLFPAHPGGANTKKQIQRSAVALVGVIIFAVVLL